jgi:hypothetical protein
LRSLLIILAVLLVGIGLFLALRSTGPVFYLGGIQVNEPDHDAWVSSLAESGMNTVAVTVYAKQADWDSTNLWWEEEEPWVIAEARAARRRGLDVALVLRVALDHAFERNKFFWHGMIMPNSDEALNVWFDRYSEYVLKWARIAEEEKIDVLAIGSELNSLTNTVPIDELPALEEYWSNAEKVEKENAKVLEHRESIEGKEIWVRGNEGYAGLEPYLADRATAHALWAERVSFLDTADPVARVNARRRLLASRWSELIERTRQVYSGPLTYAANFDQFEAVSFWSELDLISINAYFPLRKRDLPGSTDSSRTALFATRWTTILQNVDALRDRQGVPDHRVLFTELGYTRRANSTVEPWAAHGFSVLPSPSGTKLMIWEEQPDDPLERAEAVRGLYEANLELGGDFLAGILYWKLSTEPAHSEVEPFVLIIGDRADEDPLLAELQRFTAELPVDRRRARLTSRWQGFVRYILPQRNSN